MLKIKELREEAQMTQKQLAEKISNMQRNISNWEKGVSEPDLETVVCLADLFGVTLDELFGRVYSEKTPVNETDKQIFKEIRKLTEEQKCALINLLKCF